MIVTRRPLATVVACVVGRITERLTYRRTLSYKDSCHLGRRFGTMCWLERRQIQMPGSMPGGRKAARYRAVSSDMLPASRELIEMAREHKALGKQIGGLEKQRENHR